MENNRKDRKKMDIKNLVYCGNLPKVADELVLFDNIKIHAIIVQKGTVSNEMLYLSLLRSIPLIEVSGKIELEHEVNKIPNLDAIIICGFGIILTKSLLDKLPVFNFHPGKLPEYKGRHPTFFATVAEEKSIGMTLHEVTPEIDAGKIFGVKMIPYYYYETEVELAEKFHVAVRSLLPTLMKVLKGESIGLPNEGGVYYKPVSNEDKSFTSTDSITRIINIVRAQSKYEGGIFINNGKEFWVRSVQVRDIDPNWIILDNIFFYQNKPIGIKLNDSKLLYFESVKLKKKK